jgi:hypothetical protein
VNQPLKLTYIVIHSFGSRYRHFARRFQSPKIAGAVRRVVQRLVTRFSRKSTIFMQAQAKAAIIEPKGQGGT